jgi:uncharacterized protein YeaO (DUF488 family)
MKQPMIHLHRVYDQTETEGARILVDRLWPRGMSKARLRLDDWIREIAPSDELRHLLHGDPTTWPEFIRRYQAELDRNPQAVARCLDWCAKGPVTFLFAVKDPDHNNAVVLRDYLIQHQKEHRKDGH